MDREAWNARYAGAELVWRAEPNRFLVDEVAGLEPGTALDLACGEGRNAVWLATQGWKVTGVDFSSAGLAKGRAMAAERSVAVEWLEEDLSDWEPPEGRFDLVVLFYVQVPPGLRSRVHRDAARSLAPGGTLLVVAHDLSNLTEGVGGPQDPSVLYTSADVLADVEGLGLVVERAEPVRRLVEGQGTAIDVLVRARRPD